MDIFLNDKTSLQLVRTIAHGANYVLEPSDVAAPAALQVKTAKLANLGIPQLLGQLRVPEAEELGVVVPSAKDRLRVRGISCNVLKRPRGARPFLMLGTKDGGSVGSGEPDSSRVFVMSPANIVLGMASRLHRMELDGRMDHQRAVLMLVKLCLELCGTYAHDPLDPHAGEVAYGVGPFLTADELVTCLRPAGHELGIGLAREVAPLVYERSGSPQESFLGPALFYGSRLGGLDLGEFVANEALDLSPAQRQAIGWRTITPDFQIKRYRSVVEYVGGVHQEGENPRIDHVRTLDYQTLGYREFDFSYEDVRRVQDLVQSASRIVTVAEQYDGPKARDRFRKLVSNASFRVRQNVLFEVFRPWLR